MKILRGVKNGFNQILHIRWGVEIRTQKLYVVILNMQITELPTKALVFLYTIFFVYADELLYYLNK